MENIILKGTLDIYSLSYSDSIFTFDAILKKVSFVDKDSKFAFADGSDKSINIKLTYNSIKEIPKEMGDELQVTFEKNDTPNFILTSELNSDTIRTKNLKFLNYSNKLNTFNDNQCISLLNIDRDDIKNFEQFGVYNVTLTNYNKD